MHAMLDIETLGTKPNSPVLSAAVVFFNPRTGQIFEQELFLFDPEQQPGREINFSTMKWWMGQTTKARAHWSQADFPDIDDEIERFVKFCGTHGTQTKWWGNSPAFDQIIMESLLNDFDWFPPWKYWNWRDVRTIRHFLQDKTAPANNNAHNPISDCIAQIESVVRFYTEQTMVTVLQER